MSDEKIEDGVVEEEPREKQPKPEVAAAEIAFAPSSKGKEAWKGGSGCSSRLPLYGCVAGLLLLIGFLIASTSMVKRSVWVKFERERSAIVNALPRGINPAEATRTRTNLKRFRAMLERVEDPYPLMGEFVNRKNELLADSRLEEDELERLNLMLEKWIEESGIPTIQLDARIRNGRPPLQQLAWAAKNSKLRIQYSKFA